MLTITNIPNEVYAVACDYEGIDWTSWENEHFSALERAKEAYTEETRARGYTDGGLEKAISDYMKLQGDFNQDTGTFKGLSGYVIK